MGKMKFNNSGKPSERASAMNPKSEPQVIEKTVEVPVYIEKPVEVPVYVKDIVPMPCECKCKDSTKDIKQLESYIDSKFEEMEDSLNSCHDSYKYAIERTKTLSDYCDNNKKESEKKMEVIGLAIEAKYDNKLDQLEKELKVYKKYGMIAVGLLFAISLVSIII